MSFHLLGVFMLTDHSFIDIAEVVQYDEPSSLGTYVYPDTPLPLPCDLDYPTFDRDTNQWNTYAPNFSFTILIPSASLLSSIPKVLPIWGTQVSMTPIKGQPFDPMTHHSVGTPGMLFGHGRAGYTDDSDVRLVALHSGFVALEEMRCAAMGLKYNPDKVKEKEKEKEGGGGGGRRGRVREKEAVVSDEPGEKKDLKVKLYWRGIKATFSGSVGPKPGGSIQSASWGSSHDGGMIEVASVEWLPVRFFLVFNEAQFSFSKFGADGLMV